VRARRAGAACGVAACGRGVRARHAGATKWCDEMGRYELAQDPRDVENYNDCVRHETLRVAVCDMCGDTEMSRSLPDPLRELCGEVM